MKYVLVSMVIILSMLLLLGPDPSKKYVKTEGGLIPYSRSYCEAGLTFNNKMQNIYNDKGNPLQCSGYIDLTREEVKEYSLP